MTTPTISDKLGDFTQVQLGPTLPVPILNGVPGLTVTIANQDLTNVITIARRNNFTQNGPNTATIPPLGSITVDAGRTIWGLAPAGTLPPLIFPGGGNWAPSPAQVAAQIQALGLATAANQTTQTGAINNPAYGPSTLAQQVTQQTAIPNNIFGTGVPLYNKSTVIVNISAQVIAAGATFTLPGNPYTIGQPTVEVLMSLGSGGADTTPFATLTLTWIDSTSGSTLESNTYQMASATSGSIPIHGIIIAHGDRLSASVKNNGTTSMTVNILILANSKLTTVDNELWRYTSNVGNITPYPLFGGMDQPTNILADINLSVAATGGTQDRLLPFYAGGAIQIGGHTDSGTTDGRMYVQISSLIQGVLGYGETTVYQVLSNSGGDFGVQLVYLPRTQCSIHMVNNNASARNFHIIVVGSAS